jgi:6-phosphogluconolactonase (cycloisomerase 2 family)
LNVIKLEGTGPNNDRQDEPYMHQAFYLAEHNEILVPNLAGDRVHRLTKSPDDGKWKPFADIRYPPGSGPRHVEYYGRSSELLYSMSIANGFSPIEGHLYCVMELSNQIAKSKYPQAPTEAEIKSTLSNPPPVPHTMLAAELLIPQPNASYPTPYVYISNRNDPSPEGDTIAIFSHDNLELLAEVRTGLKHVRGMMFGGEKDKYLIAGGADGGGFKVFERIDGGKGLKVAAALGDESVKPTGFYWLN